MAICVFCGEKAAFGKTLEKTHFNFKVCAEHYEQYKNAGELDIVIDVLRAGILESTEDLEEWILDTEARRREELDSYNEWKQGREAGICPKCGGEMLRLEPVEMVTNSPSIPTMNLTKFNTALATYEPHRCEDCGYTEFYSEPKKKLLRFAVEDLEKIERLRSGE